MAKDAFVVIEHLRGQVSDISYVALAAARKLVEGSDGKVLAVLLGQKIRELAKDLAADEVLYVDGAEFQDFTPDAYSMALAALIKAMHLQVTEGHFAKARPASSGLLFRVHFAIVAVIKPRTAPSS